MPATIVQTNHTPFAKVAIDPVTLDIIENALRNARVEMDATLVRTAMSPGIREQGDAFPLIADHTGKMIVGQFGSFIGGFLSNYDGTLEDGDMIFLSDPYSVDGAISHSNDWLVLLPVFKDGRLIAYTSMFGHQSDIGGKVVGSMPINARSIYEEGVRIPPVKIWKKGEYNADLMKLVMHQTRKPDWCAADLNALIASCRVAARRVVEMAERFGDDVYVSATQELLARNHRAMKTLLGQAVSEEPVSFEDYICDDGMGFGPYRIKCTMWRDGETVVLDFDGTDPQSVASINFYLNENMFKMFFGIYMIMVFDPQILFNDGFYDLIDVRIPEGSLLKPRFPAALSGRTHALGRIFDILGGLLGQKTPEFLNAAGFSSSPHLFYAGNDTRPGKGHAWFQLFQIGFGGIPGRPLGDGPDGHSLWPGFTNVPNEFLERYFPMMIERYSTEPDSGGAGLHRGGNGIHMTYRFLSAGTIAIHDDRWFVPPWGVNGGDPGKRARKILEKADGSQVIVGNKVEDLAVEEGDQLHFITWGGGGWGDPLARDPALVGKEIVQGLVTPHGARAYGVVADDAGVVDTAATQALRDAMTADRGGALPVFNTGPGLDALRAACQAETGLPAPIPPVWPQAEAAE
ncbi:MULTISPECIES: hydantoinase B/oxoprolinase family protein [unclassified Novosphingobium]|uniref:hydantoinase B/oxoprolinase family protein n=1 Tax=unclassified Novosphingobium TaxID=2644732 RepID=UPI001494BDEE|nr:MULTISPECIES: hydantoinase B/oxoprolinase family protein [unclassified Novosphingobium]MBB3357907.1 N-methylhydantoinase B [Novosphingobium sp. BK256]MBB3374268.1 N-methylhydantoinase B [Novosphingobium sp. BK280]MBB3378680.1 N-methylhydantoinase B [Novosphingobium sp. BK258]MBB3420374.1 N-methylhydantoinase B [Novosphingobium sp. BK267]MBB3448504.1 N-methylhydantoinase B [Novosphingobium sp. BK352]